MSLVHITSKEQFSSLLGAAVFVVADFYADWCGPCKAIAPAYEQLASQLSRPGHIIFTKINVDEQQDVAKAYSITAMPTFIVFERGRPISTVRGADPRKLNEVVQKLATEAGKAETGTGGSDETGESGGIGWLGAAVPKNYSDISDQYDPKSLELLNRDSAFGVPRTLFAPSKPSALSTGKAKAQEGGQAADWVESDTDEQLMLYVPFQSSIKVHSLQVTSLPPSSDDDDDDDDERPMRPKTLRLYINRSHVLGFDEAEDIPPVQEVTIQPEDYDAKTGTAKIELRFVKFQSVTSLVLFFVDGHGDRDKLRIDRIRILGEAGEKREKGRLEKIGDEPGE